MKMTAVFFIRVLLVSLLYSSRLELSKTSETDPKVLSLKIKVHRHGDRTPVLPAVKFLPNPENVLNLTQLYGYGRLTDVGKRRSYKLGQFIRHRYDNLLSPHYNREEIYIQSTDSDRTEVTALIAMSAVFPSGSWREDINWEPVPYTTENRLYDYNLASLNCPTLVEKTQKIIQGPVPSLTTKYVTLLNNLTEILGLNVSETPTKLYFFYDTFMNQINLGVPLDEKSAAIFPELTEAAADALYTIFSGQKLVALEAGVLLNKFFESADKLIAGGDIPRVHVYSAHEMNVFNLQTASRITPRQGVPNYCSLYALELRKVVASGQYIVVPVFLPQPGEDEIYLEVEGCEGFCDLDRFRELTAGFVLDEKEWRAQCAFREDYDFDFSLIS